MSGRKLRRLYSQNRTGRLPKNGFSHAAVSQMPQPTPSVGAHDDQIPPRLHDIIEPVLSTPTALHWNTVPSSARQMFDVRGKPERLIVRIFTASHLLDGTTPYNR